MAFREDVAPKHNNVRHVPCIVLVDTSGSMSGAPINEINEGLMTLRSEILSDEKARLAVEISVISFNSTVDVIQPFVPAENFVAPRLSASGCTAMNQAILAGLDEIQQRKEVYRATGVDYYRPWMFLMTDGAPTDDELEQEAIARLNDFDKNKKVCFFAVGSSTADMEHLKKYRCSNGAILSAKENFSYKSLFKWLSASLGVLSTSKPDSKLELPSTPSGIVICS